MADARFAARLPYQNQKINDTITGMRYRKYDATGLYTEKR